MIQWYLLTLQLTSNNAIIGLKTDADGNNNDYEDGTTFDYVQWKIN